MTIYFIPIVILTLIIGLILKVILILMDSSSTKSKTNTCTYHNLL